MISQNPDFTLSRSGNDITIDVPENDGNAVRVFKADAYNKGFTFHLKDDKSSFPRVVETTEGSPKFKVSFVLEESTEVWNTSTEVWNTSTEVWFQETTETRKSISKFTK